MTPQLKEDCVSRQAPRRGKGGEGGRRQSICTGRDMGKGLGAWPGEPGRQGTDREEWGQGGEA